MKLSEAEIRKWAQAISDDYMHYSPEDFEYVVNVAKFLEAYVMPDGSGGFLYCIMKDFDCKKKLGVVLLYCKREYRNLRHLKNMFDALEEIARKEGVSKITIGDSDSGYKEEKFNRMLEYFGYKSSGHKKEL